MSTRKTTPPPRRPYRLHARAHSQAQTHQRIIGAIVALHQELGPAKTTISAIAQRANVERLTVYRHFPTEFDQFIACSAHWTRQHPAPDPAPWQHIQDPTLRTRTALDALYRYYARGQPMLSMITRDAPEMPDIQIVMQPFLQYMQSIARTLAKPYKNPQNRRLLTAAIQHALNFNTWQSFATQNLSHRHTVDLMTRLITAAAQR